MTLQATATQKAAKSDVQPAALRVRPLEPTLAGEVELPLQQPLDAPTVKSLRAALLERKVLVFRRQNLSPERLQQFATRDEHARRPPRVRLARVPATRGAEQE